MTKLSTGDDSTLGTYKKLCDAVFGDGNKASAYFAAKIAESPNGPDEVVLADESQVMVLIQSLLR